MVLREKHKATKVKKSQVKRKIEKIKSEIEKSEKKLNKAKSKLSKSERKLNKAKSKLSKSEKRLKELNGHLKEFKRDLRKAANNKKNTRKTKKGSEKTNKSTKTKSKKEKNQLVSKDKALVPDKDRSLRKIKKTSAEVAPTVTKALTKKQKSKKDLVKVKSNKQNLKVIDGIGPKIQEVLNEAGIKNYAQLARCSNDALEGILKVHFQNWGSFNSLTWPEQAMLADAGKFDVLEEFKRKLK